MMQDIYEKLACLLPQEQILREEPMKKHTTFRIGGPAELYICPPIDRLPAILALAAQEQIPLTVIGNGSNLLVGDKGIRGLVVEIGRSAEYIQTEEDGRLRIGAGTLLVRAANAAAEAGLSGMEFAAGIPGTLGGAVVMNAGAYGGEMKDILHEVSVIDHKGRTLVFTEEAPADSREQTSVCTGDREYHDLSELDLAYRHSIIPERQYLVTEAVLQLQPAPKEEIRERMNQLRQKRAEKQPLEFPSAGSTFKRPEGYFAGKLIEDAGLKGYQVGGAQVSEKHSGFVINTGNATAADVRQLIADVQARIREQFGVRMEPEVRFVGEF